MTTDRAIHPAARENRSGGITRYTGIFLPGVAFLLIAFGYALPQIGTTAETDVNQALPIALGVVCAATAVQFIRVDKLMVMSPLFWFLCMSVMYFGIGPVLYYFGSEASVSYALQFYRCSEPSLLKSNMLNAVCIAVVYLVGVIVLMALGPPRAIPRPVFRPSDRDRFIFITLAIGVPIRYILTPMNDWLEEKSYIPQQFLTLGDLVFIDIYLLVYGFVRGDRRWIWILFPLLGWEFLYRLLGGAKLTFFLFGLSAFLGVFMARPNLKIVFLAVAIAIPGYLIMTEVTEAVRSAGSMRETSYEKRITAVTESAGQNQGSREELQKGWIRFAYWTGQAYCIDRYDAGYRGTTVELVYWVFVPRFLFPEKPEMTPGKQFNIELTGNAESKSSPGFFAEAYWSGGWILAVVVSAYVGLLFGVMTRVALYAVRRADYRWLPLVWGGIVCGMRPDDWFVATYVASIPLLFVTCLSLYFVVTPASDETDPVGSSYRPAGPNG
jgi:hypothetical protein